MIIIENVVLPSNEQWDAIIRGMRNPKNSWRRTDSDYRKVLSKQCDDCGKCYLPAEDSCDSCELNNIDMSEYTVGPNDFKLMNQLASGGPVHAKYRRMMVVFLDITAPLYWWKEFDTYKIGTVANSCSTMHKIQEKEFTLDDFSVEHLANYDNPGWDDVPPMTLMNTIVDVLEVYRRQYNVADAKLKRDDLTEAERKHTMAQRKHFWWQMIQLLPSSYNQKRTVMLNYEVLVGIYKWRKNHKLDEWCEFCKWIETLPYAELITGKKIEK